MAWARWDEGDWVKSRLTHKVECIQPRDRKNMDWKWRRFDWCGAGWPGLTRTEEASLNEFVVCLLYTVLLHSTNSSFFHLWNTVMMKLENCYNTENWLYKCHCVHGKETLTRSAINIIFMTAVSKAENNGMIWTSWDETLCHVDNIITHQYHHHHHHCHINT